MRKISVARGIGKGMTDNTLTSNVLDFLTFQSLISPCVLIVVYWIGALACPFVLIMAYRKADAKSFPGVNNKKGVGIVLLLVVMAELAWRMLFEFLLVYFQIREALL